MSDPIRTHFMKMWTEARKELVEIVEEFRRNTNDGNKKEKFYENFKKLKRAVKNYKRVYQLHRITDKIIKRKFRPYS